MAMELIKEITQIPGLLKEVYGDLAKPGVEQVGKALGTVIGLGNTILWPIALANEKASTVKRGQVQIKPNVLRPNR